MTVVKLELVQQSTFMVKLESVEPNMTLDKLELVKIESV